MLLERIVLKPLERILFLLNGVRGFRRLDLLFNSRLLANRRVIFPCLLHDIKFALLSNPNDDLFSLLRSNNLKSWEPGSLAIWTAICKKSTTVVDVGAYSGIYSILAVKNGVENVFSVEPNPKTRERLEQNLSLNQIESCTVLSTPLGKNSEVTLGLYVPESSLSSSAKRFESSGARYLDSQFDSVVIDDENWHRVGTHRTSKLDDLLGRNFRVDAMKIDAEGMEIEVLEGCEEILRSHRPHLIIETWSDKTTQDLNVFLKRFGYTSGTLIDDEEYNKSASNLYFSGAADVN